MKIRPAREREHRDLLALWMQSVRATHDFVARDDLAAFAPEVEAHLESPEVALWVLESDEGALMGFMGMVDRNIDLLFLDPAYMRRGGGRMLVEHARAGQGTLTVDVNEQNYPARRFYAALGFEPEGRSPRDGAGRPYPLLHLRWRKRKPSRSNSS